jgi:phage/plasmid-like protein (TIGR03299 family)
VAHGITASDRFGETRKDGKKAWHMLGEEIPEGLGAWEGFKRLKLDWETALTPVEVTVDGHKIVDEDFQIHYRKDNYQSLGVVGVGYKPISNKALAEFADALVGEDAAIRLETAGSLRGGKKVFLSCKLPRSVEVSSEDILDLYVIGSNTHDGSGAFQFYGSSIRPVCENTLGWSERSATGMIRFEHSGDTHIKVEQAQAALGILVKDSKRFDEECHALAKLKLKKDQLHGYFDAVYDATFGKISADWPKKEQERRAEHKTKMLARWMQKMEEKNQQLKGIKGSAWAAYNSYSEWSDHERGRYLAVDQSDARVHSNLFGVSHVAKRKAFSKALALV